MVEYGPFTSGRLVSCDLGLGHLVSGTEHLVGPDHPYPCPHDGLVRACRRFSLVDFRLSCVPTARTFVSYPVSDIYVPDRDRTGTRILESRGLAHAESFRSSA